MAGGERRGGGDGDLEIRWSVSLSAPMSLSLCPLVLGVVVVVCADRSGRRDETDRPEECWGDKSVCRGDKSVSRGERLARLHAVVE